MFFNGQHRQAPVVSLGGNSKINNRQAILERATEERRRRQEQKRKFDAATRIQRCWKSFKNRILLKTRLETELDVLLKSLASSKQPATAELLGSVIVRLIILYDETIASAQHVVQVCAVLARNQQCLRQSIASDTSVWGLRLKQFLSLLLRVLSQFGACPELSASMLLRAFSILLEPGMFPAESAATHEALVVHLCLHAGYFSTILKLIRAKLPAPMEYSSRSPSPFADSLLKVLTLPFLGVTTHRDRVLAQLSRDMLPLSCHPVVRLYILPALSNDISLSDFLLSPAEHSGLAQVSMSTSAQSSTQRSALAQPRMARSVFPNRQPLCEPLPENATGWVLYGLLQVTDSSYLENSTSREDVAQALPRLLDTVSRLLPSITPPDVPNIMIGERVDSVVGSGSRSSSGDEADADNAWSSAEAVLATRIPPYLVSHFLQGQCRRLLTDSLLSRAIVLLLDSTQDAVIKQQVFKALSTICLHYLLYQPSLFRRSQLFANLCYRPIIVHQLWVIISNYTVKSPSGGRIPLLELIKLSVYNPPPNVAKFFVEHLSLFCALLMSHLSSVDNDTFTNGQMVFSVVELTAISTCLLDISLSLLRSETLGVTKAIAECMDLNLAVLNRFSVLPSRIQQSSVEAPMAVSPYAWALLFQLMSNFLRTLHNRSSSAGLLPPDHWLVRASQFDLRNLDWVDPSKIFSDGAETTTTTPSTVASARTIIVLRTLPFITPFLERAELFMSLVAEEKDGSEGTADQFWFRENQISVRRSHVYEDAFADLCALPASALKRDLSVRLINFQGLDEAGIDGGGVLREFLAVFMKTAFDSSRGLFKYTDDQHVYPNPAVKAVLPDTDPLVHYKFLGKMLGKVMYENLLVDIPFASFFVQKVIDGPKYPLSFDHLESLDPQVYKNLLYLRNYSGDVASLSLNFTMVNDVLGRSEVVELKPNGNNIAVTNDNCHEYIAAVANYKLNTQIQSQCAAFREGLASMINIAWLRLFTANEAKVLIAGAQVPVDVEDLRNHTVYLGGFHADHPTIKLFWEAVFSFDALQRQQLLKFVTSCSRPPLLGFKDFYPRFAVHNGLSTDRLPSASTCMNLLKLPPFEDLDTLKERLLYAISSESGFELS